MSCFSSAWGKLQNIEQSHRNNLTQVYTPYQNDKKDIVCVNGYRPVPNFWFENNAAAAEPEYRK